MQIDRKTYIIWFKWSLLSLLIVALYGALMRYKIAFDFPFFTQKNLLHAHSHFAFSAWISHTLYCGLIFIIAPRLPPTKLNVYNWLVKLNLFSSFGMLIAFTLQGYKAFSIFFSTISIIVAVLFCIRFFRDSNETQNDELATLPWAKAGLLLNVISAAGPFALVYVTISKNSNPDFYSSAIYYYLHFQYNGWFFFTAMALAIHLIPAGIFNFDSYFKVFTISLIPAYGLSILWVKPPLWIYIVIVLSALVQLATWLLLVVNLYQSKHRLKSPKLNVYTRLLLYAVIVALSIKFFLQALSAIPSLSHLAFGFRSIIIAYLHLVLLGVYSLFLLFYALRLGWMAINRLSQWALSIFFLGVLLNETFLCAQGIASFSYTFIPYINESLFVAALVLLGGASVLFISQKNTITRL